VKRLIYIILFLITVQLSFGQQLPLYSQYQYSKFLINPAVVGSEGFTSFNITAREQWVGYSGAPRTYSLSFQSRILKKKFSIKHNIFNRNVYRPKTDGRIGYGGYIFSDKNGPVQRTGFAAAYSYNIWVQDYTQLSMGLGVTGYHLMINVDETSFEDPSEPWLNDYLRKGIFIPDIDFGLYLLNARYSLGFSAQSMLGAALKIGEEAYDKYMMSRHYYAFGSYSFNMGHDIELEPAALVKMSEQIRPQLDVGLTFIYNQSFWLGATYRTGGALIGNFRIRYQNMYLGYAFDFTLNEIQKATYGTHELIIALKLGASDKRFRWLDRY